MLNLDSALTVTSPHLKWTNKFPTFPRRSAPPGQPRSHARIHIKDAAPTGAASEPQLVEAAGHQG